MCIHYMCMLAVLKVTFTNIYMLVPVQASKKNPPPPKKNNWGGGGGGGGGREGGLAPPLSTP